MAKDWGQRQCEWGRTVFAKQVRVRTPGAHVPKPTHVRGLCRAAGEEQIQGITAPTLAAAAYFGGKLLRKAVLADAETALRLTKLVAGSG